ncbi:unnamed protein product [Phyllotreta striolata]|uniref:RING-CH-type domain-containing protein n=1 Tax=Phyllotreta striolata TaxID=444603 RepID=A0A9N9XSH1_PHYSR|nr:unnamed protein product [Phyllotreta striolata]
MYDEINTCSNSSDKFDLDKEKSKKLALSSAPSIVRPPARVQSTASAVCRICHTNTVHECLISPCNCRGTMEYVHLSCLERWLNQSSRNYCELCMYRFKAMKTKRYKLCESLKLWVRHPRNRDHIGSDALIGVLLTILTAALVITSSMGMEYFMAEGSKLGVRKDWIRAAIFLFLFTVIMGYLVTVYLIIRDHFSLWYRWWTSTVDFHLLLPPSVNRKFFRQINIADQCIV